jgi:DNA-binding beta-propeller fold protein YncE
MINTSTMAAEEVDVFFPRPHPMVLAGNGWAYTGSLGVNQIAAVEIASETVELTDVDGEAHALVQFAMSPDNRTLVAATEVSGLLLVFDVSTPAAPKRVASVAIGPMAFDPIFAPDGRTVWVPVKGANEVKERIRHEGLKQPHAILFSADGTKAFVSNNNKADHMAGHEEHAGAMVQGPASLVVVDVATHRVLKAIEIGKNLTGIGARAGR